MEKNRSIHEDPDARGMIPIEKNIIVSDVNGRRIGATYPKRAAGLVKSGRAERISDHEIRLKITQSLTVSIDTEEKNMSKVIHFNARNFEFDSSCNTNVGFRGFVTTALGNEEVWEIGNWNWDWTQICANLTGLEKNMDYVFRFAMTLGHNDDNREESLVHIHYNDGDGKQAWEDRFTYCIRMSRFKPVLSKRDPEEDTMIRVFELPFNTGKHTDFRIIIVSQHAVARFFTARENAAYEKLEDLSYAQWREQRTETLNARKAAIAIPPLPPMEGFARESITEDSIQDMIESAVTDSKEEIADMLEDRIGEAINDSISEFFGEGLETFLATHPLVLRDGTVVSSKQQTKVLSPDKKKLLNCYGGLTVEDTTKWNGVLPKGWGLRVQTRISCWELLYVYETESQATEALVKVQKAIEAGEPLIAL